MSTRMFGICCLIGAMVFGMRGFSANPLHITLDAQSLTIIADGQPMMRYRYAGVPFKPYVQEFFTPGGVNILRDAPHDHLHHHALMYAIKVDDVNYWEEIEGSGRQEHRSLSDVRVDVCDGVPMAGFTEELEWVDPGKQAPALQERRSIAAYRLEDAGATLLTWESCFSLPPGKTSAVLGGAHYHGLGMRFITPMDAGGTFRNASEEKGEIVRGDEKLTPSTWCSYTAMADEKPVTVAMFDPPGNVRHPAKWFTMHTPFAYLSATLGLWKAPLELVEGKPLTLRYAAALWDGEVDAAQIEAMYQRWLAWPAAAKE